MHAHSLLLQRGQDKTGIIIKRWRNIGHIFDFYFIKVNKCQLKLRAFPTFCNFQYIQNLDVVCARDMMDGKLGGNH